MHCLKAIQAETIPMDNHTDPGALQDCWATVWEYFGTTLAKDPNLFYCTVCGDEPVNVEAGFDTCDDCLSKMER